MEGSCKTPAMMRVVVHPVSLRPPYLHAHTEGAPSRHGGHSREREAHFAHSLSTGGRAARGERISTLPWALLEESGVVAGWVEREVENSLSALGPTASGRQSVSAERSEVIAAAIAVGCIPSCKVKYNPSTSYNPILFLFLGHSPVNRFRSCELSELAVIVSSRLRQAAPRRAWRRCAASAATQRSRAC